MKIRELLKRGSTFGKMSDKNPRRSLSYLTGRFKDRQVSSGLRVILLVLYTLFFLLFPWTPASFRAGRSSLLDTRLKLVFKTIHESLLISFIPTYNWRLESILLDPDSIRFSYGKSKF